MITNQQRFTPGQALKYDRGIAGDKRSSFQQLTLEAYYG
jgi:hypothetical protein